MELLYRAVSTGDVAVVDTLLRAGARCDVQQSPAVPTPLHACAAALASTAGSTLSEAGLAVTLAHLVAKHPRALSFRDARGRTPADVAAPGLQAATPKGRALLVRALCPPRGRLATLVMFVFRAVMVLLVLFVIALVVVPDPA